MIIIYAIIIIIIIIIPLCGFILSAAFQALQVNVCHVDERIAPMVMDVGMTMVIVTWVNVGVAGIVVRGGQAMFVILPWCRCRRGGLIQTGIGGIPVVVF